MNRQRPSYAHEIPRRDEKIRAMPGAEKLKYVQMMLRCYETRLWQAFMYTARTKVEVRRHNLT